MKLSPLVLGLCFTFAAHTLPAPAQDGSAKDADPKFLSVTVEYLKPGKGPAHDKNEAIWVQLMRKGGSPLPSVAYDAISGRPRTVYLGAFSSFAEVQKAHKAIHDQAGLSADLDKEEAADGEFFTEARHTIISAVPELSFHSKPSTAKTRYLEADIFLVRPGHGKQFDELIKTYMSVFEKAGSSDHWGAYRTEYGDSSGSFVMLTASESMTDIDQRFAEGSKISAALTEEDKKKVRELRADCLESERTELYVVNPTQSYPPPAWVAADPGFWKK